MYVPVAGVSDDEVSDEGECRSGLVVRHWVAGVEEAVVGEALLERE